MKKNYETAVSKAEKFYASRITIGTLCTRSERKANENIFKSQLLARIFKEKRRGIYMCRYVRYHDFTSRYLCYFMIETDLFSQYIWFFYSYCKTQNLFFKIVSSCGDILIDTKISVQRLNQFSHEQVLYQSKE